MLGKKEGKGKLWINKRNYLSSSLERNKCNDYIEIDYINLASLVPEESIDILKLDIEGAEIEFLKLNINILKRTNLIILELHDFTNLSNVKKLLSPIGFKMISKTSNDRGYCLLSFKHTKY